MKTMVFVPLMYRPTPFANLLNLFAPEWDHVTLCFGPCMSWQLVSHSPVSLLCINCACSNWFDLHNCVWCRCRILDRLGFELWINVWSNFLFLYCVSFSLSCTLGAGMGILNVSSGNGVEWVNSSSSCWAGWMSSTLGSGVSDNSVSFWCMLLRSSSNGFNRLMSWIPLAFLVPFSALVRPMIALMTLPAGVSVGCVWALFWRKLCLKFLEVFLYYFGGESWPCYIVSCLYCLHPYAFDRESCGCM